MNIKLMFTSLKPSYLSLIYHNISPKLPERAYLNQLTVLGRFKIALLPQILHERGIVHLKRPNTRETLNYPPYWIVVRSHCTLRPLLKMESLATSSPGSSRFSIWRRLGRRPWHTAESRDQNFQRGWKCIQNGG